MWLLCCVQDAHQVSGGCSRRHRSVGSDLAVHRSDCAPTSTTPSSHASTPATRTQCSGCHQAQLEHHRQLLAHPLLASPPSPPSSTPAVTPPSPTTPPTACTTSCTAPSRTWLWPTIRTRPTSSAPLPRLARLTRLPHTTSARYQHHGRRGRTASHGCTRQHILQLHGAGGASAST